MGIEKLKLQKLTSVPTAVLEEKGTITFSKLTHSDGYVYYATFIQSSTGSVVKTSDNRIIESVTCFTNTPGYQLVMFRSHANMRLVHCYAVLNDVIDAVDVSISIIAGTEISTASTVLVNNQNVVCSLPHNTGNFLTISNPAIGEGEWCWMLIDNTSSEGPITVTCVFTI